MPGGGTRTFNDAGQYETALRQAEIDAAIVSGGKFNARLTSAELHHLQLLRCEEDTARAAYVRSAPGLAFVTFPAYPKSPPIWRGTQLQVSEVTFHRRGEQLHQPIPNSFVWSVIIVKLGDLDRYSRALSGKPMALLPDGPILQLIPRRAARLRRVHAQACRLAETKSKCCRIPRSRGRSRMI